MTFDPVAWLTLLVAAITLACILIRPRDIGEGWISLAGASGILLIGAVAPRDLPGILDETSGILLFLLGMMVITGIVDRAGIFDLLAEWCAGLARGHGFALYILLFLLGAAVTTVLSLDVTVIMMTPIVYAVTRRRNIEPLPFMFAIAFVANTASLALPVSNLTNLLLYEQLHLSFTEFAAVMWFPNLVALVTNLAMFLWLFRKRIPRHLPENPDADAPLRRSAARSWQWVSGAVLCFSLGALFWCGVMGWPLWWAAMAGAATATVLASSTRRLTVEHVVADVSWPLFVFVISMTVLVRGIEHTWLDALQIQAPTNVAGIIVSGVLTGAIGSNIINNVPMTVLAGPVIAQLPEAQQSTMAYAVLVGTNIGPALTTYGSLATMLWLTLIRKRGIAVSTRTYLAVSFAAVPIVLLTTSIALWAVTHRGTFL